MTNLESRTINLEYEGLTPGQITSIKIGVQIGKDLQGLYPEIAEDYRKGMTYKEIVKKYNITEQFELSERTSQTAVRFSIRGIVEIFGLESYSGLITDEEELERLAKTHKIEGGKRLYEQGKGIHGKSEEEMREAGKMSAISRGQTLWTELEEKRVLEIHKEIGEKVYGKNVKIAKRINQEFYKGGKVRTSNSIVRKIQKLSK